MAGSSTELKVVTETLADSYQAAKRLIGESSDFYNLASNGLMREVKKLNEMWQGQAGDVFVEKIQNEIREFSEIAVALNELADIMKRVEKTYKDGEREVRNLVDNIDVTV